MHEMYYQNIKKFQKMGMGDSDMQFIVRQKYNICYFMCINAGIRL